MTELHRINGRWLASTTSNLCIHSVNRAEPCARCNATTTVETGIEPMPGVLADVAPGLEAIAGEALVPESDHNRVVAELDAKLNGAETRANAAARERDGLRRELDQVAADVNRIINGSVAPEEKFTGIAGDVHAGVSRLGNQLVEASTQLVAAREELAKAKTELEDARAALAKKTSGPKK